MCAVSLETILAATRERVARLPRDFGSLPCTPTRSLARAIRLAGRKNAVIGELKYASPSGIRIARYRDPVLLAREIAAGGCIALSILTEPAYFGGSNQILEQIRQTTSLPILRKDFILDERQVYETRAMGADAILLIARILGEDLPSFVNCALACNLEPLIEVQREEEIEITLSTNAPLIGINNRDLETLEVDRTTVQRLSRLIPRTHRSIIGMSGIRTPADLKRMKGACDAVLIGTAIMESSDPRTTMEEFVFA